jgi:hypothetical protein
MIFLDAVKGLGRKATHEWQKNEQKQYFSINGDIRFKSQLRIFVFRESLRRPIKFYEMAPKTQSGGQTVQKVSQSRHGAKEVRVGRRE